MTKGSNLGSHFHGEEANRFILGILNQESGILIMGNINEMNRNETV